MGFSSLAHLSGHRSVSDVIIRAMRIPLSIAGHRVFPVSSTLTIQSLAFSEFFISRNLLARIRLYWRWSINKSESQFSLPSKCFTFHYLHEAIKFNFRILYPPIRRKCLLLGHRRSNRVSAPCFLMRKTATAELQAYFTSKPRLSWNPKIKSRLSMRRGFFPATRNRIE